MVTTLVKKTQPTTNESDLQSKRLHAQHWVNHLVRDHGTIGSYGVCVCMHVCIHSPMYIHTQNKVHNHNSGDRKPHFPQPGGQW